MAKTKAAALPAARSGATVSGHHHQQQPRHSSSSDHPGASPSSSQSWKSHLESISRARGIPPFPRQTRHVVAIVNPTSAASNPSTESHHLPAAVSMRQLATQFKMAGGWMEDPVEDVVRSLPLLRPTLESVAVVHDIAALLAEYYDLLAMKRRAAAGASPLPPSSGNPPT